MAQTETVTLDLTGMLDRFRSLGPLLAPTVYTAMLVSAKKMLSDVVSKRMSNGRRGSTATNLGVDTGTARRSMVDQAGFDADHVFSLIGSPIDYVAAHELGFQGTQHVRAHARRNVALERNTKTGRVSKSSARAYKAAARAGHVLTSNVRAHGRQVNIVAKHFIRDTVIESKVPTEDRILRALQIAVKTGRTPSTSQLGA
jgi:hypothetical protein